MTAERSCYRPGVMSANPHRCHQPPAQPGRDAVKRDVGSREVTVASGRDAVERDVGSREVTVASGND